MVEILLDIYFEIWYIYNFFRRIYDTFISTELHKISSLN